MNIPGFLVPPVLVAALLAVFSAFNVFESAPIPAFANKPPELASKTSDGQAARVLARAAIRRDPTLESSVVDAQIATSSDVTTLSKAAEQPLVVAAVAQTVATSTNSISNLLPTSTSSHEVSENEVLVGTVEESDSSPDAAQEENYLVPPTLMTQATPIDAQAELAGETVSTETSSN